MDQSQNYEDIKNTSDGTYDVNHSYTLVLFNIPFFVLYIQY